MTADPAPVPYEDFTVYAQAFAGMDRAQLLAEARKWCMSALLARDKQHQILLGTDAMLADYQHRLGRAWALIPLNGKTIRADDLRAVLADAGTGEDAIEPEWRERARPASRSPVTGRGAGFKAGSGASDSECPCCGRGAEQPRPGRAGPGVYPSRVGGVPGRCEGRGVR